MCRLALFNRAMCEYLGEDVIAYHFQALETKLGGDGMGVSALFSDGKMKIKKDVLLDADTAAEWVMDMFDLGATHFLFHTRLATQGSKIRRNCHPFRHGNFVAAHNGSCVDYKYAAGYDRTDSEGVIYTIARTHLGLSFLEDVSGVFIGFHDGLPFVVKGQSHTDLELATSDIVEGAYMYTSNIFKEEEKLFSHIHSLKGYAWYGNAEIEGTVKGEIKSYYSTSSYYSSRYDDYNSWDDDKGWVSSGTKSKVGHETWGKRLDGTWGYKGEEEDSTDVDDKVIEAMMRDEEDEYDSYIDEDGNVINHDTSEYEGIEVSNLSVSSGCLKGDYFYLDGNRWVNNGLNFQIDVSSERSTDDLIDAYVDLHYDTKRHKGDIQVSQATKDKFSKISL